MVNDYLFYKPQLLSAKYLIEETEEIKNDLFWSMIDHEDKQYVVLNSNIDLNDGRIPRSTIFVILYILLLQLQSLKH